MGNYLNNIKVYNKKVIALVWEYIVLNSLFWRSCPRKLGQLCQKNFFNTLYSHTSAITYNTVFLLLVIRLPSLIVAPPPEKTLNHDNIINIC